MLPANEHWCRKKGCVGGDPEGVYLPRAAQSILNRAGIPKLDLTQNMTYLIFRAHERYIDD